jgi:hypothetical protein
MPKKTSKGQWHGTRTSGQQKQLRVRDWEKNFGETKKSKIQPVDMSKPNWSLKLN